MKKATMTFFAALALLFAGIASAYEIGTGSTSGMFYPTGQKICGLAAEKFIDCQAVPSGGSADNVAKVEDGELDAGLAMLPVAKESGLPYVVMNVGEAAFVVANPTAAERIRKLVGGMDAAVFPAALKLAGKGRVTFVTIGENSGETALMRQQLEAAGAPASALKSVSSIAEFVRTLTSDNRAFGFVTRIPNPGNEIFLQMKKAKLEILGAFNPALKDETTKVSVVEVAGVKVKTPVTPVAFVYDEGNADAKEVLEIVKGVTLKDILPAPSTWAKVWGAIKGAAASMKEMTAAQASALKEKVEAKLANIQ